MGHGEVEAPGEAARPHGGAYLAAEAGTLLPGGALAEAEQCVGVHAKQAGEGGEQGDVGVGRALFPLVDRGGGDPQIVRHLLLGEAQRLSSFADDLVHRHLQRSFR